MIEQIKSLKPRSKSPPDRVTHTNDHNGKGHAVPGKVSMAFPKEKTQKTSFNLIVQNPHQQIDNIRKILDQIYNEHLNSFIEAGYEEQDLPKIPVVNLKEGKIQIEVGNAMDADFYSKRVGRYLRMASKAQSRQL